MIKYAKIVYDTIVDGTGLRNTLYVSGCSHNCLGCHNKALQDYNYGYSDTNYKIAMELTVDSNKITFSGGEPFEQAGDLIELINFIEEIDRNKEDFTKRDYWIYSGYTFEQILEDEVKKKLLELCEVLVDGKFDINLRDPNLKFRGSSNQRLINIKESLKQNKVVELDL